MSINAADIKLLESEVMTDATDGGGRRTTHVIPDGVAGNIFPKVSRLDTVYGRLNLRKVFGHVDSANVDTYAGAHAIVTDPPDNPKIGVLLFGTGSDFDRRSSAKDRIESYVVSGPESRMRLYGRQPVGAKAVLAYQRPEETLPDIGDVYTLVQEDSSGNTLQAQYVRIQTLATEVRTFVDDAGEYKVRVLTIGITAPITYAFVGPDAPPRTSLGTRLGKVRTTSAADTARYFGIQPITESLLSGALSIKVESIYAAIVPTTQREAAISLAEISGAREYVEAGITFVDGIGGYADYRFPGPVMPGTVVFSNSSAGYPIYDDGDGNLLFTGMPTLRGTIDYSTGVVSAPNIGAAGGITATAVHAVPVSQPGHTSSREISINNRGSVYSEVLSPAPAPRTTVVDYRALGKWYRLRDEIGDGTLSGFDASVGTGTVDYVTGALVVTLGALPDVGSANLYSWGSPVHYVKRAGATSDATPRVKQTLQLAHAPLLSNSVTLTFRYASVDVDLPLSTSNTGANADVSASVNTSTGLVTISYIGRMPDRGSLVIAEYHSKETAAGSTEPVSAQQTFAVTYPTSTLELGKGVSPGTVRVLLPVAGSSGWWNAPMAQYAGTLLCEDDGAGALKVSNGQILSSASGGPPGKVQPGTVVGAINYTTGSIGISGVLPFDGFMWQYALGTRPGTWIASTGNVTKAPGTATVTFSPADATSDSTARIEEFSQSDAPFRFDLTTSTGETVVPGSVVFQLATDGYSRPRVYVDRSGDLVYGPAENGTAATVGSVNYQTGEVTLTEYATSQMQAAIKVLSCVTFRGEFTAQSVQFRTSGSPVRPGSLFIQVVAEDGTQLSGTSDINGAVTGTLVSGVIQQNMGVVNLRFGEWKPVSGNTAEPWYEAENIDPNDATRVWKPTLVMPSTLRYSAVVTTNVTLDAAILGIDPVRLPLDGRVPMIRPADVGVLHNTQALGLPNPAVASAVYSVGRSGLSDLWLVDAAGVRVDFAKYTADIAAGTVTMAAGLDLTGVPQPLVAKHRISDMVLVSDAQIDGTVDLAAPLTHDYPTTGTYFSTALLFGDLYARVSNIFDQATWTGVWSDAIIGDGATAQFNEVLYPIEVLNSGAVTERWRLQFTAPTAFQCIGENSGVIATGTTTADFGPVNPLTLEPYFVIRQGAWGSGWAVGNNLRFNTFSAGAPIWMARTVLPGATLAGDSVDIQLRGDVDA